MLPVATTILGIDPGSTACGMAVITQNSILYSETVNLDKMYESAIIAHFANLYIQFPFDVVSIEQQPHGGKFGGAVWAAKTVRRCLKFANITCPIHSPLPQSWRSRLGLKTQGGRINLKQASIDYVKARYDYDAPSDDEAEAICLAADCLLTFPL